SQELSASNKKLLFSPLGFISEAHVTAKILQMSVARDGIKPDARIQLVQVNRTQVHGLGIIFDQMIWPIHHTTEVDAMVNAEHVSGLVRQHLTASPQHDAGAVRGVFTVEMRIVANKAVNAHTVSEQRLAKNEIPAGIGVQISQSDSEQAISVARKPLLEQAQNVLRKQLGFASLVIHARGDLAQPARRHRQNLYRHGEECFSKSLQSDQRRRV